MKSDTPLTSTRTPCTRQIGIRCHSTMSRAWNASSRPPDPSFVHRLLHKIRESRGRSGLDRGISLTGKRNAPPKMQVLSPHLSEAQP